MSLKIILLAGSAVLAASPAAAQTSDAPRPAVTGSPPSSVAAEPPAVPPAPGVAAQPPAVPPASGVAADIVVTGRLDAARASIQPSLGATTYSITNATIQALPGGDNQQLNQILLQLPGVVQDGFGQFHVRDDHNGLQYRINGTILPEGVAVFGQTLSPRLVERFDLRTGALPAQYGLRTAGIVDIKTKSGFDNGGEVSLYGGSHATIEPSIEYGGSHGSTDYFATASYRHDDLGIEAVDAGRTPRHDTTDQIQAFGYLARTLSPDDRVSLLTGYADQRFQIPDPRGLHPQLGYDVGGRTDFLSDDLDERQHERTGFAIASLLHDSGPLTVQASAFVRYSSLDYFPDIVGELLFNGAAERATKRDLTVGGQVEGVYRLSTAHIVRAGLIVSRDHGTSDTTTQLFPVIAGVQSGQPYAVVDNGAATEMSYSVYLQDEWKPVTGVTVNLGGRFDHVDGFRSEQALSPRINVVVEPAKATTIHLGYARYFSPPPFANVATNGVATLAGTSAAAPGLGGDLPFAERQDYVDIGAEQKLGRFSIALDGYHRRSRNLIDEGQFGAPIILTPFNYAQGRIDGVEGDISYTHGPLLAYLNLAYAKAKGRDIVSGQFNIDPANLAIIASQFIYLDHDQTYTGSAGLSYRFRSGLLDGSKAGATMIYGSGLRRDGVVPNGGKLPPYAVFNLTASHRFAGAGVDVRADVNNVLDHVYEIRDGSGVGVGAPQFGQRRGFFVGVSKSF